MALRNDAGGNVPAIVPGEPFIRQAQLAPLLESTKTFSESADQSGAALLLITDAAFPRRKVRLRVDELFYIFSEALATIAIPNHRLALTSYLEYAGLGAQTEFDEDDMLIIKEDGLIVFEATFDDRNRLKMFQATLKAAEASLPVDWVQAG